MIKRIAALIIAVLLCLSAMAETAEESEMSPEEVRAFVEMLFTAATGTTYEEETALREEMTDEELTQRNAFCADYRAKTFPWLFVAFEIIDPEAKLTPEPESTPEPEATPDPDAEPAWTIEDSYAAFSENPLGAEYLTLLAGMGGGSMETDLAITREICLLWMQQIDHAELLEMNEDYVCWLYAPSTQIDYPVVHCADNSHYLKRMFNGETNSAGTLFIDYRNLSDFQDPNTLIYGHHMRNDSMFGTLTDYDEQAYFESHPYMFIMNSEAVYLVELFAGYTTDKKDHCYDIAISGEEDMLAFVTEAVEKSDFISAVEVQPRDNLVTFSTCAYAFENARYIAIGRLVKTGEWSKTE